MELTVSYYDRGAEVGQVKAARHDRYPTVFLSAITRAATVIFWL
jgi:hypothetical protein